MYGFCIRSLFVCPYMRSCKFAYSMFVINQNFACNTKLWNGVHWSQTTLKRFQSIYPLQTNLFSIFFSFRSKIDWKNTPFVFHVYFPSSQKKFTKKANEHKSFIEIVFILDNFNKKKISVLVACTDNSFYFDLK